MNCGTRVGLNSPLCDDCSGQEFDAVTFLRGTTTGVPIGALLNVLVKYGPT